MTTTTGTYLWRLRALLERCEIRGRRLDGNIQGAAAAKDIDLFRHCFERRMSHAYRRSNLEAKLSTLTVIR